MSMITKKELGELINIAKKMGASDAKAIKPSEIVVRNWVRLKCQYGCDGYGKILTCPPFSPTPERTMQVLKEYEWALLMKFEGAGGRAGDAVVYEKSLPNLVVKIERAIFLKGFYAAFGLAAGPCSFCSGEDCNLEQCRHPFEARPSMESCGIDVFATVRNAGFKIDVVRNEREKPTFYALLLVA